MPEINHCAVCGEDDYQPVVARQTHVGVFVLCQACDEEYRSEPERFESDLLAAKGAAHEQAGQN